MPKRIAAPCPIFGTCGGCSYQDIAYKDELSLKENLLKENLNKTLKLDASLFKPIVASPQEYNYRHRIDLKLERKKTGEFTIGFSPYQGKKLIPIESCPIARKEINAFIPKLPELVKEKLTPKYRQANIVIRTGDDGRVLWGGIGHGSLKLTSDKYLWTKVAGKKIFFSLDTFFQANLFILPKLFQTLKAWPIWTKETIFLDLYGGVGLFSLGLSGSYKEAYLIEEVGSSITAATYNKNFHTLNNLHILEGRVEDHLFKILESSDGKNIVAMIDPPRAGLSEDAQKLMIGMKNVNHLIYLSCHPESLARDLGVLTAHEWKIKEIVPFDFFPRTKHLETLVWLGK